MNKIRRIQKRSPGFESLEGRLTLSSGLTAAPIHAHDVVVKQIQRTIPFSFSGHTTISGSTQSIPDLAGRIGSVRFAGSGSATISGTLVVGGDAFLTSRQGNLHLHFGTGTFTQVGRRQRQEVPITVMEATGKLSAYTGLTGTGNSWNVPANPKRLSSFSGFFNPPTA
jgi:hypothetical protein